MVTYDIIKEKLLDYHLLTGEALGSRQTASQLLEGTGTPQSGYHPQATGGFRRSGGRHGAPALLG